MDGPKVNQAGSDQHIIVPEMNGLSVNKKPLSLFQCQLKLFKVCKNINIIINRSIKLVKEVLKSALFIK